MAECVSCRQDLVSKAPPLPLPGGVGGATPAPVNMKPFAVGQFRGYTGLFDRNILEWIKSQPGMRARALETS